MAKKCGRVLVRLPKATQTQIQKFDQEMSDQGWQKCPVGRTNHYDDSAKHVSTVISYRAARSVASNANAGRREDESACAD